MCEISYKGFTGKYSLDNINKVLIGKVDPTIIFHGVSIAEVEADFKNKIDAYLEVFFNTNKTERHSYKFLDGRIRFDIPAETHRIFHLIARSRGTITNDMIKDFINKTVEEF